MRSGDLFLGTAASVLVAAGASAGAVGDDGIPALAATYGGVDFWAGGEADALAFSVNQPDQASGHYVNKAAIDAVATLKSSLAYNFTPAWSLSLHSSQFLRTNHNVNDEYGSNLIQTVYAELATPYGTASAGMADGASAALAVRAPVVDPEVSLSNPHVSFDRGEDDVFINTLKIESVIRTTYNYSKLSYYSPAIYGFTVGVSYTPAPNRDTVPFLNNGEKINNLDVSYWEGAVNYAVRFGNVEAAAYLGGAFAQDNKGEEDTNHLGLTNWAFGGKVSYAVDEEIKLSLGAGFHRKNSYLFFIDTGALQKHEITSLHIGAKLDWGRWSAGVEYGDGAYKGNDVNYYMPSDAEAPHVGVRAYGAAVGYAVTSNLDITAGWQQFRYSRNPGTFMNGAAKAEIDAAYVKLRFKVM